MQSLLNIVPKQLLDDIKNGRCIPIIGAGFSKNAIVPHGSMPLWKELGDRFADELDISSSDNPLDSISDYCSKYKKAVLIEKLRQFLYISKATPSNSQVSFAKLYFKKIITTNYDFLIEKAFEVLNKPFHVIASEDQLSINFSSELTQIIKFHGDFNHPNKMVITEEDYDLFLNQNPLLTTYVSSILINMTPLFIGYSLNDPDIRQLLKVIHSRLGKLRRPAYTLGINLSQTEKNRFERRGIQVINVK